MEDGPDMREFDLEELEEEAAATAAAEPATEAADGTGDMKKVEEPRPHRSRRGNMFDYANKVFKDELGWSLEEKYKQI